MTFPRSPGISHHADISVLKLREKLWKSGREYCKRFIRPRARRAEERGEEAQGTKGDIRTRVCDFREISISDFRCACLSPSPLVLNKGHLQITFYYLSVNKGEW